MSRKKLEPTLEELKILALEAEIQEPVVLGPLAERPEDQKALDQAQQKLSVHTLAERFMAARAVALEAESQFFYEFIDGKYKKVSPGILKQYAEQKLGRLCNNKIASEFIGKIERIVARSNEELTQSTIGYINFRNGHYHKPTDTFEERTSKLFHTERFFAYCLPFDYDPKADAQGFEQFLTELTSSKDRPTGDYKMAQLVLEYLGSTISGDKPLEHKALMLIGEGRNGKSVLLNVVQHVLGEGNYKTLGLAELGNPDRRPGIERVLANICSEESPKSFRDNSEALKAITAGDTIGARVLRQQPYDIKPTLKLWLATNNPPESNDSSHGFHSRIIPQPCEALMVGAAEAKEMRTANNGLMPPGVYEINPNLEAALCAEAPGIFNLAWDAYAKAKRRGEFTKPEAVTAMHSEMKDEGSLVQTIIRDTFRVVDKELPVDAATFWPETAACLKAFVQSATHFGWRYALDQRKFNKEVERTFGAQVQKFKTNGKVVFKGLQLKTEDKTNQF